MWNFRVQRRYEVSSSMSLLILPRFIEGFFHEVRSLFAALIVWILFPYLEQITSRVISKKEKVAKSDLFARSYGKNAEHLFS